MEILFLLIPLAVALMVVAALFFLWTVKNGQYDDLDGPAHRILMDDDDPLIPHYGKDRQNKASQGQQPSQQNGNDPSNGAQDQSKS